MARPSKNQPVDLSQPANLTVGLIERLACPEGKEQAFLRDALVPGLRVRVSAQGAKSFVFERKIGQRTVRRTLGDVRILTIDDARAKARQAHIDLDEGKEPVFQAAAEAVRRIDASTTPVREAWADYLADRKPHWSARHYSDHVKMAGAGGEKATRGTRGTGKTKPGVLHALMGLRLAALDVPAVEAWAAAEAQVRPSQARLGARMLSAFINWCDASDAYAGAVPRGAATVKTKRVRETLGRARAKADTLQREQLLPWFAAVRSWRNPVVAAYLQVLLLTGARPNEVRDIRWTDIDWVWGSIVIRDKVEGDRTIPLPPYVAALLATLPRRNDWVFSSPRSAQISSPNHAHDQVCTAAGVTPVTLHGLRRSFGSLAEWLEMPAGVVAQIQGHKPSATAEKHYRVRPLDLLRVHHERFEAWILDQGAVHFSPLAKRSPPIASQKS